jgi:hypothetical protein
MADAHQLQRRALVIALLASLILWPLPFGGFVLYPFKLFATWIHETSHGLVMLLVGAGFDHLEIFRDTSGIAYAQGGTTTAGAAAIASAGYMGASIFGAIFLVLGQTRRGARTILGVIAALLALSAALWVRNRFGLIAVSIGAAACAVGAALAGERTATFVVNFIAAQSCTNAVLDIRVLFRPSLVINGQVIGGSDAHNMAAATFGSHWLWASVWLLWSFAMTYLALRVIYVRQHAAEPARQPATAS